MSTSVHRRCGCRDKNGKQYGTHCPDLKSNPKHGSWAYYLSAGSDSRTKKRRQYRQAGFATKREAASAVAELKTKLDKGTYVRPTAQTLGEYAQEWLPRRERSDKGLKATTVAGYERYITDDITPSALGGMRLTDIRRYHVATFAADLTKAGRGAVTVRRIVTLLGTILASAVKDELISANPAIGADKPALSDGPVKVWEPDDVRTFLMRCSRHRLGALFEIAVLTGLRRGELCGCAGRTWTWPPGRSPSGAAGSVFAAVSLSRRRRRRVQVCVRSHYRTLLSAHC